MTPTSNGHQLEPHDHLLQYASTVNTMQHAIHRIFANKKAISESLTRTAASLRSIATVSNQRQRTIQAE